MPKRNHIKVDATADNTLRGIGKLGFTEKGKLHSTIKKITATFEDKPEKSNKNKEKIVCPGCKGKFTSNNGKLKEHIPSKRWGVERGVTGADGFCTQQAHWTTPPKIKSILSSTEINDISLVVGDKICFQPYPHLIYFKAETNAVIEATVEKIYLMNNDRVYLKISNNLITFPLDIFTANKNFIKV